MGAGKVVLDGVLEGIEEKGGGGDAPVPAGEEGGERGGSVHVSSQIFFIFFGSQIMWLLVRNVHYLYEYGRSRLHLCIHITKYIRMCVFVQVAQWKSQNTKRG